MGRNCQMDTQDYASALRAIGQDVADSLPLCIEVEVTNGKFVVHGRGLAEWSQGMDYWKNNLLRQVWNMLARRDPAADIVQWELCSVPFVRSYSREDIRRLNENNCTRRRNVVDVPDMYSLGERLRVVGRIVDGKRGDLVKLSKTLHGVSFQYLDEDGQIHLEELSALDLYCIQQEYYAERKTVEPDGPMPGTDRKKTIAA